MKTICVFILTAIVAYAFAQNETTFVVKKKPADPFFDGIEYNEPSTGNSISVASTSRPSQVAFFALGFQLRSGDTISAKAIEPDRNFFAGDFYGGKNYSVASFKLEISNNGKKETLSSGTSYFTTEMKKKLAEVKAGSMIVLKEIKYAATNTSPDDTYAGPFKLFVKE